MSGMDGLEVLRRTRAGSDVHVLLLPLPRLPADGHATVSGRTVGRPAAAQAS